MARLIKSQTRRHEQACTLLEKNPLTFDEKWFVLENWHEGASQCLEVIRGKRLTCWRTNETANA